MRRLKLYPFKYRERITDSISSTFVIDCNGMLVREWRGVRVPGHAEAVLEVVQAL